MEAQKKKKGKKLASRPIEASNLIDAEKPMEASKPNEDLRAPQETSPAFEFPHFDLIVHANTCRKAGLTNCSFPRCSEIQKFIVHMKSCNLEEPCPISLCNFYQSGTCHKKTCKSPDSCKVCEHLTNVKARIRQIQSGTIEDTDPLRRYVRKMIQKLNKLNEVADNLDRDRFRILIETGTEFLMLKTNYMDDKVEKEAPLYHKYIISTVASITATANIYKIKVMMNRGAPEKESK